MSDTTLLPQHLPKNVLPLPQRIPITYLWFGKDVPEDYLISLAELNYPVQFLKNPHISRSFTRQIMDIEKSDYYRLQHLYDYGGIYSDFDNVIDYECLMKLLEPYRKQDKLVFMTKPKHNRATLKQMTNNLIFAPYAGMPILKKMLDSVDENKGKIWGFAGMKFVARFPQPLEVNMDKCVKHTGDWSWADASNKVLHKKTPPHSRYSKKLVKKRDILAQKDKLQSQIKQITNFKNQMSKQLSKIKQQNLILKDSIDLTNTQVSKQVIDQLKAQDEHKLRGKDSRDMDWGKDERMIKNQMQYLMERSQKLEAQKDMMLVVSGGAVVIVLMLMLIGALLMKKRKSTSEFKPIVETSRNMAEEQ